MSKSYYKHFSNATGKNTEYFRSCARQVRNKNKQMLRDLVPIFTPDTLDEDISADDYAWQAADRRKRIILRFRLAGLPQLN